MTPGQRSLESLTKSKVKAKGAKRPSPKAKSRAKATPAKSMRLAGKSGDGRKAVNNLLDEMRERVIADYETKTTTQIAEEYGVPASDIRNLVSGHGIGMQMLLRMVARGRLSPNYLILGKGRRQLKPSETVRKAQPKQVHKRLVTLLKDKSARELSEATGLSINTIYQCRVPGQYVGIRVLLGLVLAGHKPDTLVLGS